MDFTDNKPISKQIEDYCRMQITSGSWQRESRIPSTKDLAVHLGVNPRTVMKAYDALAAEGTIYAKRGMGYYVSPSAMNSLKETKVKKFMSETLPEIARQICELNIDTLVVFSFLDQYIKEERTKNNLV